MANLIVTHENKPLIVETLRLVAEIGWFRAIPYHTIPYHTMPYHAVIWGDQNDALVFEYFLEKDMVTCFDKILAQKPGSFVSVQLLQTLSIMFENLKSDTAICE